MLPYSDRRSHTLALWLECLLCLIRRNSLSENYNVINVNKAWFDSFLLCCSLTAECSRDHSAVDRTFRVVGSQN